MYYECNPVLALTAGFSSRDRFRYFTSHPCVQLPLQEFIDDYFGTNRDIGSIEERGWYPILRGMTAVFVDEYAWPDQVKNGWAYERHVARFICQVYYRAERSGLPWWQRTDNEDDYAKWGYQLYELLLYLCEVWLEEQTMPGQILSRYGPGDKPGGVAHHDAVGDQEDYLLDVRHLYLADQDQVISPGTADDAPPLAEATESHTKGDIDSDDGILTAGTPHDPEISLKRRSATTASSSLSSRPNGQANRAAPTMEVFDGPWATCPLPWRRGGRTTGHFRSAV
jgi:hypothetical protein